MSGPRSSPRSSVPGVGGIALSVHGPHGVLDLLVPSGASIWDVAREYAAQSGSASVPLLFARNGAALSPDLDLEQAGVVPGSILVATTGTYRPGARRSSRSATADDDEGTARTALWFVLAGLAAAVAGWLLAVSGTAQITTPAVVVLLVSAGLGVVPIGRFARLRALTAPVFAGAAAYALLWDPDPLHLPTIVGGAALAAAVTAGIARSLGDEELEGLDVWIAAGSLVFLVAALAAVVDVGPPTVWSLLLLISMLASRFVPMMAIEVPDHHLIDLDRLAASAWSAREVPRSRRGRTVVSERGVTAVARRGARVTTAATAAIASSAGLSSVLLLDAVTDDVDRTGACYLVFFVGASLLLVARSYRHRGARALLRGAGLLCWAVLARGVLFGLSADRLTALSVAVSLLAALLVLAAVATGRGWRSAWWSRRAEVAESLAGAAAIAALVVSSGLFVMLWELTSANAPSR